MVRCINILLGFVTICLVYIFLSSREEVETWKEKQRQVAVQEMKQTSSTNFLTSHYSLGIIQKRKLVISGIPQRKVWIQIAEYLIHKYRFETARVFLEEANISAEAFHDFSSQELIAYNHALISYQLRDWGKVISTLENVMWIQGSQEFWLKKILLLADALHNFSMQKNSFQNYIDDIGFTKAKSLLRNAIFTIDKACQKRSNGICMGPYIKAKLLSRLGSIIYVESMERQYRKDENRMKILTAACGYLEESFQILSRLGYQKDSIDIMFLYIDIKRQMALLQDDIESKKALLVHAFKMAESCAQTVSRMTTEITTLSSSNEMENIFLPIQYELVKARKVCVNILCEIISIGADEKKRKRLLEESKAPVERVSEFPPFFIIIPIFFTTQPLLQCF